MSSKLSNPYSNLPPRAFWRSGVAESHPLTVTDLYRKKFSIQQSDRIATAGSCFAQHLAVHLRKRGYDIIDAEPPVPGMSPETAQKYGYLIYSGRYGNIYTVRQFLQLLKDAADESVRDEDIWEQDGRYFDGLRPAVEPNGLSSPEEVRIHRLHHLRNVRQLFSQANVVVFTLGLTEAWVHRKSGTVYPVCPGVVAGRFDPDVHEFCNFEYPDIYQDMVEVREFLRKDNPDLRLLLTVSPVPLTATAANDHVLVATTWSKSTLRSVCGALERRFSDVDYFPSYELIASPSSRGFFYAPNLRSVTSAGVDAVMRVFFDQHQPASGTTDIVAERLAARRARRSRSVPETADEDDVVCEEKLLEAFG